MCKCLTTSTWRRGPEMEGARELERERERERERAVAVAVAVAAAAATII